MVAFRKSAAMIMTCAVVVAAASDGVGEGASNGTGQAIALLQVSATMLSPSPSLPPFSGGPSTVFQQMSSQVSALEQQMVEVQEANAATLADQRAKFAQELRAQDAESHKIEEQNSKIDASLSVLNKENKHLRRQAAGLQKECANLKADMRVLVSNFTTSLEFASESLVRFNDSAVNLSVLREVDTEDAALAAHAEHAKRFDGILREGAPAAVSFLQTDAQPGHGATAYKQMLAGLEEGFEGLAKEHDEAEAALKKQFDEDFRIGAGRQSVLLTAHASLAAAEASSEEQRTRLQAAVRQLQQTREFLQERILALRAFAGRLGHGATSHKS